MYYPINNLVFEGGGILGIAYLGVLNYLSQAGILQNVRRVAGTSAGAVTACLTSFNLPFGDIQRMVDTLDFRKIPGKEKPPGLENLPDIVKKEVEKYFGDIDCLYRLFTKYGWYSSQYFYDWLKKQIADQFDSSKKGPPYTFADFRNPYLHKNNRPFRDLYIIGTDISHKASRVFSYETTPSMEVAEAVRISISIPLFFEAITIENQEFNPYHLPSVFSDGGVMRNYPINLFDQANYRDKVMYGVNAQTLGARFNSQVHYSKIHNLIDFVKNLFLSYLSIQQDVYNNSPEDRARSIQINTKEISPVNFNITPHDETYHFLYQEGYHAAYRYFQNPTPQLF